MTQPAPMLKRQSQADLPPVIIGAGPAGVRAAQTLLAHGRIRRGYLKVAPPRSRGSAEGSALRLR